MNYISIFKKNISDSMDAKAILLKDNILLEKFSAAIDEVVEVYKSGGRIYIAGNGGSAADAQHLAAEFVSKLARDRHPLPAEAITTDSSVITAIANDYGYNKIFSRQLSGKLSKFDIFLGFTTSGNSENIINAIYECKNKGVKSIVFTGYNGGVVKDIADYCISAPGRRVSTIQEVHILLAHTLCECVEHSIFPLGGIIK